MKIGDKIKVDWQKKVAGVGFCPDPNWNNVTIKKFMNISDTEKYVFVEEFPMCAARVERISMK